MNAKVTKLVFSDIWWWTSDYNSSLAFLWEHWLCFGVFFSPVRCLVGVPVAIAWGPTTGGALGVRVVGWGTDGTGKGSGVEFVPREAVFPHLVDHLVDAVAQFLRLLGSLRVVHNLGWAKLAVKVWVLSGPEAPRWHFEVEVFVFAQTEVTASGGPW